MTSYENFMCGIYAIKNINNNKIYIGQSVNITHRWRKHRNELKNGIHINPHLQHSWDIYGEESFQFLVLELCNVESLNERELFYINKYQSSNSDYGYNIKGGGDSVYSMQEETKRKIGAALTGKKWPEDRRLKFSQLRSGNNNWTEDTYQLVSGENHWSRKNPNRFFELNGAYPTKIYCPEYNMIFNSINDGAKYSGVNKSNIAKVVKGERFTAGKHKETGESLHWYSVGQTYQDEFSCNNMLEVVV